MQASQVSSPARAAPRISRQRLKYYAQGYAFISPWIIGTALFTVYPVAYSAVLTFTKFDLLTPPEYIGAGNFDRMIGDSQFPTALINTAYYTFIAVPLQLFVALVMALFLNQQLRFINVFRTLFYLPTVTPTVASVIIFMYLYNPDFGFFNVALGWFGIPGVKWLGDPNWAKPALILLSLWYVGGQMVIFLAGLQSVPDALLEAASIDGAGTLRKFWHVTIPMITPTIFFNLVLGIIGSFQVFTVAFIATRGGPIDSTLFYVLWIYRHAFENLNMGYAAAIGWVLLVIILIFTLLQFAISQRWVYYEAEGS